MSEAPCKVCGYKGQGFYQPDTHPCPGNKNWTRPQPSAEPVAWMYERPPTAWLSPRPIIAKVRWPEEEVKGWTETPLYSASALEAARREALEQAAKRLEREWPGPAANIVRALKENTNG